VNAALRFLAVAVLALALSFGAGGTRYAHGQTPDDDRVISGQVVNRTDGESAVPGLTVILHRDTAVGHDDEETVTDEEGQFCFEGMEFDPSIRYGVSVFYQGTFYGTDVDLGDGSPDPMLLIVYEATQDQNALTVSAASLLLTVPDEDNRTLWGLEIVKLRNSTDTAYVPGSDPMSRIRFGLPPGAVELQVHTTIRDAEMTQVDIGFALKASVPPGEFEVMYAYVFPYAGDRTNISKSFPYGADSVRILAPYGIGELQSVDLGASEIADVGGKPYQLIQASNVARGASISINILDLPAPSTSQRLRRSLGDIRFEYVAPAGLVLLMGLLVGLALLRRRGTGRRRARSNDGEEQSPPPTGKTGIE